MKKLFLAVVAVSVLISGYYVVMSVSDEDAIRYQSVQLIDTARALYAAQPTIPEGDLTKVVMYAEGASPTTPNFEKYEAIVNKKDREVMLRLTPDLNKGILLNEFGGQVKVLSSNGDVFVLYTEVPSSVKCQGIPNVVCKHKSA